MYNSRESGTEEGERESYESFEIVLAPHFCSHVCGGNSILCEVSAKIQDDVHDQIVCENSSEFLTCVCTIFRVSSSFCGSEHDITNFESLYTFSQFDYNTTALASLYEIFRKGKPIRHFPVFGVRRGHNLKILDEL